MKGDGDRDNTFFAFFLAGGISPPPHGRELASQRFLGADRPFRGLGQYGFGVQCFELVVAQCGEEGLPVDVQCAGIATPSRFETRSA